MSVGRRRQRTAILGWWSGFIVVVMMVALYNYSSLLGTVLSSSSENSSQMMLTKELATWKTTKSTISHDLELPQQRTSEWKRFLYHQKNGTDSLVGLHLFRHNTPIDRIHLIGERHSGTSFFTKTLKECFPSLEVSDVFVNGKHWLQPSPQRVTFVVERIRTMNAARELDLQSWWNVKQKGYENMKEHAFKSALVVAMFRDPYQW
jgi:hypothetical protein